MEEFLAYLSLAQDSMYTQDINETSKELHGMITKGERKECKYYIETWFQIVIRPQYSSTLQHLLASYPQEKLTSHISVLLKVYFSNSDMILTEILLCKWMHWKLLYT